MEKPMRPDELRIVIRPEDESKDPARPVPARVFQTTFNTMFNALKATNTELHGKKRQSDFFISHLAMGSNEVGVVEQQCMHSGIVAPSIAEIGNLINSVYHSDYSLAEQNKKLAKAIIKIGKGIDPSYPAIAYFGSEDDNVPLDAFFADQTKRLEDSIGADAVRPTHFVGSAIGSFDGRLGNIDYRGVSWKGSLVLPGGGLQIQCLFDKSKGEDEYNRFGNKRVSITGTAIYTGDSQLPERIVVTHIEEIPVIKEYIDIRGSMTGKKYFNGWELDYKNLQ